MKRLIASIALLLIISTYLLSCEKDDICADGTPTTPSLVIEFYQKNDPGVPKNVTDLECFVTGSNKIDTIKGTKMTLPLRTDANTTEWNLRYNEVRGSQKITNTDVLKFNYQTKNTYLSRACGFKTTFVLDADTEKMNPIDDGKPWILDFKVEKTIIENENEVHIKIYL